MRIAIVSDLESIGGAAIVAERLAQRWRGGHDVQRYVGDRFCSSGSISYDVTKGRGWLRRLRLEHTAQAGSIYACLRGRRLLDLLETFRPDVINIHDIHFHPLPSSIVGNMQRLAPVVWTLHNMWSFTGGCANNLGCDLYLTGCREPCPRKHRRPAADVPDVGARWRSGRALLASYAGMRVYAVTPSRWLHECATRGGWSQDRLHTIPNGVDVRGFSPMDPAAAKRALMIPADRVCLMFSAGDAVREPDKGYALLQRALEQFPIGARPFCLIVGHDAEMSDDDRLVLGYTKGLTFLRICYAAADGFVLPSLAENAPLVLLEALAMGLPCVSFDVGGCPEIVRDGETGFVAKGGDVGSLAAALRLLVSLGEEGRKAMGLACRRVAERDYSLDLQSERYLRLFAEVIANGAVTS